MRSTLPAALQKEITAYVAKHFNSAPYDPEKTLVPVSRKTFDVQEMLLGVEAVLDGWWTEGRFAEQFERTFQKLLGREYVSLVNSGSSANLLALSALTSSVFGKKALREGDEVITVATGFPTTVNPIVQNRCVPVFIDNDLFTQNATTKGILKALSGKTKAIMLAHTLGNPLPLHDILDIVKENDLWFIEDCCDALGGTYDQKPMGSFGHIATFSFYPAHQITMGEGGALVTNHPLIHRSIRQFRDWGRDCWCNTGKDNTCGKRFGWKLGDLPFGYDHKYIYSQIGYNLKLTDMQAAIGLAQLQKLPTFIEKRKQNYHHLRTFFNQYQQYFHFTQVEKEADPCWFGFMLIVKDGAPFSRLEIVQYLEEHLIATRSLFAGNVTKHPAYNLRKDMHVVGKLPNSNKIMNDGFWIGVCPEITKPMLKHMEHVFTAFFQKFST